MEEIKKGKEKQGEGGGGDGGQQKTESRQFWHSHQTRLPLRLWQISTSV